MSKNKYSNKTNYINFRVTAAALIVGAGIMPASLRAQIISIAPATMPRIGAVDERFQETAAAPNPQSSAKKSVLVHSWVHASWHTRTRSM